MLEMLKSWNGKVVVNDIEYNSVKSVPTDLKGQIHIILYPNVEKSKTSVVERETEYQITVKKYMTEPSSPDFDFMAQCNNDNPMPLRTMTGSKIKETRGMVYMKLHGQAQPVIKCMRCGRMLTNEISQHYGIGPECMLKLGLMVDIDDVETIKKKLVDVEWEGWIVKSAIVEEKEV